MLWHFLQWLGPITWVVYQIAYNALGMAQLATLCIFGHKYGRRSDATQTVIGADQTLSTALWVSCGTH